MSTGSRTSKSAPTRSYSTTSSSRTWAATGPLPSSAFHKSASGLAHDAGDRIIYDTDSGFLSYDADGTGDDAAIQFARLSTNLDLTATDFAII